MWKYLFSIVLVSTAAFAATTAQDHLANAKAAAYQVKDISQNQQAIQAKADQARAAAAKPWQDKYTKLQKDLEKAYQTIQKNGYSYDLKADKLTPLDDLKKPLTFHPAAPAKEQPVDLDKLSKAVAVAETSGCTDGTAIKRNNCHGIMCWPNGKRTPCYFATKAASHAAFKKIWAKSYKRFPDLALAKKWTGEDHAETWLANVKQAYNAL